MHRFLIQNGMHPDAVMPPFVINLVPAAGAADGVVRSIIHGYNLKQWLNVVVNALIHDGTDPAMLRDSFVIPHLSEPTIRLVSYVMAPPPPPPPPPAPAPVPVPVPAPPVTPLADSGAPLIPTDEPQNGGGRGIRKTGRQRTDENAVPLMQTSKQMRATREREYEEDTGRRADDSIGNDGGDDNGDDDDGHDPHGMVVMVSETMQGSAKKRKGVISDILGKAEQELKNRERMHPRLR